MQLALKELLSCGEIFGSLFWGKGSATELMFESTPEDSLARTLWAAASNPDVRKTIPK